MEIPRASKKDYALNSKTFDYVDERKLPKARFEQLASIRAVVFENKARWKSFLSSLDFTNNQHIRIATEGALLGTILETGIVAPHLIILNDNAGQFDVLLKRIYKNKSELLLVLERPGLPLQNNTSGTDVR